MAGLNNATLSKTDGESYLFLSFFAVGDSNYALFCHAVKGDDSYQLPCLWNIFTSFQILLQS